MLCLGYLIGHKLAKQKSADLTIEDMEVEECKEGEDEKAVILKSITAIGKYVTYSFFVFSQDVCSFTKQENKTKQYFLEYVLM